jgi:hypothetical protein
MYRYWSCGHGGDFAVIVATQNLELVYASCRQTKNLKIHATSTTKTTRESTAYASGHTQIQIYLNNARCCSAAFVRTGFMSTILAFHPPCRFCSVVFVVVLPLIVVVEISLQLHRWFLLSRNVH